MKKTWRKNIAFLLVIAMMLTIMPVTVFAEGEDGVGSPTAVMFYDNEDKELESLSPAETEQAVIAKWVTEEQATTVYVTWNVNERVEVLYEEGAYVSRQDIVITDSMESIDVTFQNEDGMKLATGSCKVVKEEEPESKSVIYVDAVNGNDSNENVGTSWETAYKTLSTAVTSAESGSTIMLSSNNYTLYNISSDGLTKGKDLTFIGKGKDTIWNIGAEVPDPDKFGTEYNGDYSFDGAGKITFKDMTLQSGTADYLGFIRPNHTVVKNCTINGKTFYWGYDSATFQNTVFNCPKGDYAMWTYSSPEITYDNCVFNGDGKIINVYSDFIADKTTAENPIVINFKNCTVNSSKTNKSVLNVKDNGYYVVNIFGENTVNGLIANKQTCSELFQVEAWKDGYNLTEDAKGNHEDPKAVININGETVWKDGKMISHDYTDGAHDNAFKKEWENWNIGKEAGKLHRNGKKICDYCGYFEKLEETKDLNLDICTSKSATDLDSNYQSIVTLSLTGAEENLSSSDTVSKIFYAVSDGSAVEDKIGNAFSLDVNSFKLTVGEEEISGTFDETTNTWHFGTKNDGSDRFTVIYNENTKTFSWMIKENVSKSVPVQLSYIVKLDNPKTDVGTYQEQTNEYANLTPVDSEKRVGNEILFPNPTVFYTVTTTRPGDNTNPTNPTDPTPSNPSEPSNPSTEIPDPDVPLTEPEEPEEPTVIEEPDVPLVDVPGEPVVEVEEPEVPLGDAPKTGDSSNAIPFVVLVMGAGIGLAITRRKFN